MWVADQTKEQFLTMLQQETAPPGVTSVERTLDIANGPPPGTIRVIWQRRPQAGILPALLVIPESDRRDFFAWSTTYLGGWRPISGLFRVIADRNVQAALEARSSREVLWEYRNAALGMMFGEAAVHTAAHARDARRINSSFAACLSTCSFVMGRAICVGWQDLEAVSRNWHRSRVATHYGSYDRDPRSLLASWSVLAEVGGLPMRAECGTRTVSKAVVAICHALHTRDEVDGLALPVLTRESPDLERAFLDMDGARERRVRALDVALRSIGERRKRSQQTAVIALGLLASRIAPGTLDHVPLLNPYTDRLEGLLLWYGMFAGMTRAARLTDQHGGVGRRILRDMLVRDTAFSSPSCDIGLDELELISRSDSSLQNVQRRSAEHLVIEILPCVNTVLPWLTDDRRAEDTQQGLFDDETRRLESDVRDVNQAAERLLRRLRQLRPRRQ